MVTCDNGTVKCEKCMIKFDVGTTQCDNGTIKCEKKNKGITECDKSTVKCDIGTAQCEDCTIKCKKIIIISEPPNMTKVQLHVMLVLYNVRMSLSNVMFGLPSIAGCLLVDTVP